MGSVGFTTFISVELTYLYSHVHIHFAGVPCGGWCIAKGKAQLSAPRTIYTTLSPIPGFTTWLNVNIIRANEKVLQILGELLIKHVFHLFVCACLSLPFLALFYRDRKRQAYFFFF